MLAVAGGLLIAGESPPTRLALVAVVGVIALAGIALFSITWAESADPYSLRRGRLGTALLLVELEAPERAVLPVFGP